MGSMGRMVGLGGFFLQGSQQCCHGFVQGVGDLVPQGEIGQGPGQGYVVHDGHPSLTGHLLDALGHQALSAGHGELICEEDGACYYAFPTVEALVGADEAALASAGSLGFRGRNVKSVAGQIVDRGDSWLRSLREVSYEQARDELVRIRGVGAKIADCVCLFALDKDEAVPVDTHVRQLAHRLFLPDLRARSVTDAVYRRIRAAFDQRYGPLAGWAQQFLYYEDLLRTRGSF